jgi:hypothetical protein
VVVPLTRGWVVAAGRADAQQALLSNQEVLALIREQDPARSAASRARKGAVGSGKPLANLHTIEFEVRPRSGAGSGAPERRAD